MRHNFTKSILFRRMCHVFFLGIIVSLPLLILINLIVNTVDSIREENELNVQEALYGYIREHVLAGEQVPATIDKLPFWGKQYLQTYDANAWLKPEILFMYKKGLFYSVTFGDGRQVRFTHWREPSHLRRTENFRIPTLGGEMHRFDNWPNIVIFGLIAVLITTIICGRSSDNI